MGRLLKLKIYYQNKISSFKQITRIWQCINYNTKYLQWFIYCTLKNYFWGIIKEKEYVQIYGEKQMYFLYIKRRQKFDKKITVLLVYFLFSVEFLKRLSAIPFLTILSVINFLWLLNQVFFQETHVLPSYYQFQVI